MSTVRERVAALAIAIGALAAAPAPVPIALPGGGAEIGLDDLRFAPALGRVLVPAGRTGRLDLVDPATRAVESIAGFSAGGHGGGHGDGTTSADAGGGLVFASDRTTLEVVIVDPAARRIVARQPLRGPPDYVRWVEATGEVWVTEPSREAIETFRLVRGPPPRLEPAGDVPVPGGPESLVVDGARRRAYSNTWKDETVAIAVDGRAVAARWRNGCRGARGIAQDAARGLVLVGCEEGRAVALGADDGKVRGEVATAEGVDVIDVAPRAGRLYVPGEKGGELDVIAIAPDGALSVARRVPVPRGAHCVAADDRGHAFVCDPARGQLLVVEDP